jgi:hypothetical protein
MAKAFYPLLGVIPIPRPLGVVVYSSIKTVNQENQIGKSTHIVAIIEIHCHQ